MAREPYRLTYALGDLRGGANLSGQQLEVLLRALVRVNVVRMKRDPGIAKAVLGSSPIRTDDYPTGWRPPGEEEWQDAPSMLLKGAGSNTDLACARVAALQITGKTVRVVPILQGDLWRAAIATPSGLLADASARWKPLLDRGRFTFVMDVFNGQKQPESLTGPTLEALLDGLTEIDVNYLEAHPETPTIEALAHQLLYMEEPIGQEDWQDVPTCIRMGLLDCEDGACWDAAQDIVRGVPAKAVASKHATPNGGVLYHITKKTFGAHPHTRDISRILGMR